MVDDTTLKMLENIDRKVTETRDRIIKLEAQDSSGKIKDLEKKVEKNTDKTNGLEQRVTKSETKVTIISAVIATIAATALGWTKYLFPGS